MIIQIRGTSGSGKTTVMRQVMKEFQWTPHYQEGRKKPLWYKSNHGVYLLGHYESACGGCDTIGSARQVYNLIQEQIPRGVTIICEGLLLSEDTKWSRQLPDLRVVFLTTSLGGCLERIMMRRKKAGNDKPLNPTNTTNRVKVIERARLKLESEGVLCCQALSVKAPQLILKWLGETHG